MKVLVDSSIWSMSIRRGAPRGSAEEHELARLIGEGRVVMIGPIRQELLSGIRKKEHSRLVRDHLRAFPDLELAAEDFEEAADCFNRCRARGVQGSNTDFLPCALCLRHGLSIFTTDADFEHFNRVLRLKLHRARRGA